MLGIVRGSELVDSDGRREGRSVVAKTGGTAELTSVGSGFERSSEAGIWAVFFGGKPDVEVAWTRRLESDRTES